MRRIEVCFATLLIAGLIVAACGQAKTYPLCGSGGVFEIDCVPSNRDVSKMGCSCTGLGPGNVTVFDEFPVSVCMPETINAGQQPLAQIDAIQPPQVYFNYMQVQCMAVARHLNGIAKLLKAPDACTGDVDFFCLPETKPNSTELLVFRNGICDNPCDEVDCAPCDPTTSQCLNKGDCSDPRVEKNGGQTIDISSCRCNTVDTCKSGKQTTCVDPPGSDPPSTNDVGLLPSLLAARATIEMQPAMSPFTLDVTQQADGGPNLAHVTSPIRGEVFTWGTAAPDGSADVQLDFNLAIDDMHFKIGNQQVNLTWVIGSGGTGPTPIHVDNAANATIPINQLSLLLDFSQDAQRSRLPITNSAAVKATIDFKAKTFHIPSIPFDSKQGLTGSFELTGTIANQAPFAKAKQNQTLECTSPSGALATLDASDTTDPDANIEGISWSIGAGLAADGVFAHSYVANRLSPFGTTTYTFQAVDRRFQIGLARTHVTVRDTTPPDLTLSAIPDCLWTPDHKLVLYELGKQLAFSVHDTCDPNPTVSIVGVVSNQADLGGGQGGFTPDILAGKKALCLRSEREGTVNADRLYTITVQATDKFNNTSLKNVTVRVPHDEGMAGCPKIDSSRITDASDPRCTAN